MSIAPPERLAARGLRFGFGVPSGLLLAAPALALMALLLVVPVLAAVALSLTDYSLGGAAPGWVGLDNYETLLERRTYRKMFIATFGYVALVVPLSIGLGLAAALAIHSVGRFAGLYKAIYFLPVMAALLAMAIVWEFTLHPTLGTVNRTLELACGTSLEGLGLFERGCARGFPNWLGERATALPVVAFIGVWQGVGFVMVLYLAGLTAVPRELLQAARMDGAASAWERFRLVT